MRRPKHIEEKCGDHVNIDKKKMKEMIIGSLRGQQTMLKKLK